MLLTDPNDHARIFFKAGPYTVPKDGSITHDSLVEDFDLDYILED